MHTRKGVSALPVQPPPPVWAQALPHLAPAPGDAGSSPEAAPGVS